MPIRLQCIGSHVKRTAAHLSRLHPWQWNGRKKCNRLWCVNTCASSANSIDSWCQTIGLPLFRNWRAQCALKRPFNRDFSKFVPLTLHCLTFQSVCWAFGVRFWANCTDVFERSWLKLKGHAIIPFGTLAFAPESALFSPIPVAQMQNAEKGEQYWTYNEANWRFVSAAFSFLVCAAFSCK